MQTNELELGTPDGSLRAYLEAPEADGDRRSDGWQGREGVLFLRADVEHEGDGLLWANLDIATLAEGKPFHGNVLRWAGRGLKLEDNLTRAFRVLSGEQVDDLVSWAKSAGSHLPAGYEAERPWLAAGHPCPLSRPSALAERTAC